jgi:hypothetical protein
MCSTHNDMPGDLPRKPSAVTVTQTAEQKLRDEVHRLLLMVVHLNQTIISRNAEIEALKAAAKK